MIRATLTAIAACVGGIAHAQLAHVKMQPAYGPHPYAYSSAPRWVFAQHAQAHAPAPIERRPPPQQAPIMRPANPAGRQPMPGRAPAAGHLADWMNQHRDLSPSQQQLALEREPGFHELPSATQQRMRERLTQLNAMPPEQRQRLLARNEAMERLTPDQRAQVRGAMQQLGALPPDQRKTVERTFRQLRELPPDQRMVALNTARNGPQLNGAQRETLTNLIRIEPMLPLPEPKQNP
jgi:hypothetical protein